MSGLRLLLPQSLPLPLVPAPPSPPPPATPKAGGSPMMGCDCCKAHAVGTVGSSAGPEAGPSNAADDEPRCRAAGEVGGGGRAAAASIYASPVAGTGVRVEPASGGGLASPSAPPLLRGRRLPVACGCGGLRPLQRSVAMPPSPVMYLSGGGGGGDPTSLTERARRSLVCWGWGYARAPAKTEERNA